MQTIMDLPVLTQRAGQEFFDRDGSPPARAELFNSREGFKMRVQVKIMISAASVTLAG
jgi:hypothetical protein